MDFKNQPGQSFFSCRMAYRYLNHCLGAPMYTTSVFLKLLTSGKKLGMYEPEFHCPTAQESYCHCSSSPDYLKCTKATPYCRCQRNQPALYMLIVGNVEIVIRDYFQLSNDGGLLATMAENDDPKLVEKVLAWNYHALYCYSCHHSIT
ncbi:hypothetical protein SELMODRAFT_421428 [Selaginella moellendorffii]|uniref:Uncharacterized protein n=1 Tax=Selaginella moellendorffii TaxID=88036 RepID=D8SF90_SELML|nr:hypothetical protein SELMODRAFT_421428 [Selaginella moellendorffii]